MVLEQVGFYNKKKKDLNLNLNPHLIPSIKVGSKLFTDLNAKAKTIQFLEGNVRESL